MGAVAGALAAAATTPLDVIKTNMMCAAVNRPTMMAAAQAVMAQGGAAALFRGVGPRALSNGINSAVFFAFFEALRGVVIQVKRTGGLGAYVTGLKIAPLQQFVNPPARFAAAAGPAGGGAQSLALASTTGALAEDSRKRG